MKTQLAIDRGNTLTKLSVFDGKNIVDIRSSSDENLEDEIVKLLSAYSIEYAVFSDVRDGYSHDAVMNLLPLPLVLVNHTLNFPFSLSYSTPETIGHDRLANIAGACTLFPGRNVLVVDFGTCTTYSMLLEKTFVGGSISPGRAMRFKALHHFTGKLPLIEPTAGEKLLLGTSTIGSILSGVDHAILLETDSMISEYKSQCNNLEVIITGGDYSFFENSLKSATFAEPQLTQIGLHEILRHNIR
jgi:type III pantothenate kinase